MDDPGASDLERMWAEILSEDAARIHAAADRLTADERGHVLRHLLVMTEAEGWSEAQRRRARAALENLAP
jgi:hypothetical protein